MNAEYVVKIEQSGQVLDSCAITLREWETEGDIAEILIQMRKRYDCKIEGRFSLVAYKRGVVFCSLHSLHSFYSEKDAERDAKVCPHCGSHPHAVYGEGHASVVCQRCGRTRGAHDNSYNKSALLGAAVARWNATA